MSFQDIYDPIKYHVIFYLDIENILNFQLVNKTCCDMVSRQWNEINMRDFGRNGLKKDYELRRKILRMSSIKDAIEICRKELFTIGIVDLSGDYLPSNQDGRIFYQRLGILACRTRNLELWNGIRDFICTLDKYTEKFSTNNDPCIKSYLKIMRTQDLDQVGEIPYNWSPPYGLITLISDAVHLRDSRIIKAIFDGYDKNDVIIRNLKF